MPAGGVVVALGRIAHEAICRALALRQVLLPFGHAATYALPGGRTLIDSFHCSRYNTQTRRLTAEMFRAVFAAVRLRLSGADADGVRA